MLLAASLYLPLFGFELWCYWHPRGSQVMPSRGMYANDPVLSVVLNPGYHGEFDDGFARGVISINSKGARDDEPRADGSNRILLVGDSFAFGYTLDQSETIDAFMETERPERDIYNLGVPGYNLPNQNERLRRCDLTARAVVYLFFGNDSQLPPPRVVVDGYVVDNNISSRALQLAILRSYDKEAAGPRRLPKRSLLLWNTWGLIGDVVDRIRNLRTPRSPDWEKDAAASLERGIPYTLGMRDLAWSRGMKFFVAIAPTADEAGAGRYSPTVAAYVDALRKNGIAPIEMLTRLRVSDYFTQNRHFNKSGARIAAHLISEALDRGL